MIDMHLSIGLKDIWESYFAGSAANFRKMFAGGLPDALLDEWHAQLAPGGDVDKLQFGLAFMPGVSRTPFIGIQLAEQPDDAQVLGMAGGVDSGVESKSSHVAQHALITIYAGVPEIVRALHVIIKKSMMILNEWVLGLHYGGLVYLGATDLGAESLLEPELVGIFRRQQTWKTWVVDEVPDTVTYTPVTVAVASDQSAIDLDGTPGGVTALEE